jgi:hypothetical protein
MTKGEHTKCETSEAVMTISPTHSAANQMMTTALNFRNSVNLGTIPTATAVASPPTGEGIKLGWVNVKRLRIDIRPPARAHVTTNAKIQLFVVRIFTLHAKNSWTSIAMRPCGVDKYQSRSDIEYFANLPSALDLCDKAWSIIWMKRTKLQVPVAKTANYLNEADQLKRG